MWPKLMAVVEYQQVGYTGSKRPSVERLKRQIDRGEIPGEIQGKTYYVLVGPHNELMPRPASNDPEADAIVQQWLEDMPGATGKSQKLR